ncbi:hypothetical protein T4D_5399 [Trichinella pseudospiralis]|uniref:Uncharacterized protein n=1 Tax=Trichinella pseudospiralis TaxID=6337 RepID=A0A0V1G5W8_TRIPS|nr:hypothetical protein T4D_5399 [Trichinella pseudospiralis]
MSEYDFSSVITDLFLTGAFISADQSVLTCCCFPYYWWLFMCDKAESIHDTDLNDLPDDDYHSLLVAASQPNYRKKASASLGDIHNGGNSCSLSEAARNILNDLQVKANEDQQRTDRLTEVKFANFEISDFGELGFANTDYLLQKSKSADKNLHFSNTKTVMTDQLPLSNENSSSSASSKMTTADQSRAENSVRCMFETGSLFDVSMKNALRLNPDALQKGLLNCDTLSALSSMAAKMNEKKAEAKKSSSNSYFNDDLFFSKINPAWIPQHEKIDANSVARVHHQLLYRRRNKHGKEDFSCVVNHHADGKDVDFLDDLINDIGEEKTTTVQSRRSKHNKKRNEKLIHSDDESAKAGMPKLSIRAKSENSLPESKKEKKDKKHNNNSNNNNNNNKMTSNVVHEQQVVKVDEEEEDAAATAPATATAAAAAAIVNSVPADDAAAAENKEKSCWPDLMEECADADEEEGAFLPVVNRRFRRGRQANKAANTAEKATRSKTPPTLAPVDRAAEDWNRRRRGSYEHVGRDGELHNNCRAYRIQNRQNAGAFRGQGRWNGRSRRGGGGGGEHGEGGGGWTSRAPPAHAVSLQSSRESSPAKSGAATCSSRNQSTASAPALNTALINAGSNIKNNNYNNSGSNNNNNNGNISGGWKNNTPRPVCESLCLETSNSSRGSAGQVCSYAAITSGRRPAARRPVVVTKDVPETVAESSSIACQQQRTTDTGTVSSGSSSSSGRANSHPASGNKAPLNLAAFPPLEPAVSGGCYMQQQSSHVATSSNVVVQANSVTTGTRNNGNNNFQRRTLLSLEEQSNERRRLVLAHVRVDPSKLSSVARFAMKMWNVFLDHCDKDTVVVMD